MRKLSIKKPKIKSVKTGRRKPMISVSKRMAPHISRRNGRKNRGIKVY